MTKAGGSVLRLTSRLDDLGALYPWLQRAAAPLGLADRVLFAMHVALEEVVANVAMHGFAPGEVGEITIRLAMSPGGPELSVEDAGAAFDPLSVAPPAPRTGLAETEPGGRGLVLVRHYCHDVAYARDAGRNRLTMRF